MLRTCKLILVQYGPYPVALTAGLLPKHSVQACHSLGLQGMQVPQPIHGSLLDWGEKGVSANSKAKHTEPLTSGSISPLYVYGGPYPKRMCRMPAGPIFVAAHYTSTMCCDDVDSYFSRHAALPPPAAGRRCRRCPPDRPEPSSAGSIQWARFSFLN